MELNVPLPTTRYAKRLPFGYSAMYHDCYAQWMKRDSCNLECKEHCIMRAKQAKGITIQVSNEEKDMLNRKAKDKTPCKCYHTVYHCSQGYAEPPSVRSTRPAASCSSIWSWIADASS